MAPLTLEEGFDQLEKAKERPRNSSPKIQRVATHLRNRKHFEKHYSPKLVSIGPIHHGDANLELGEKYKLMWAAKYIENTGRNPKDLHKRIADNIEQLKGLFAEDVLTGMLEEKLSWMLFVDGCALLHILEKAKLNEPDHMNVKVDQLVLVITDVLLLENQIPYLVLKLLWTDEYDKGETALIHTTMRNFLRCHHFSTENNNNSEYPPAHLLDLHRRILSPADSPPKNTQNLEIGSTVSMAEITNEYHLPIAMGLLNNENNSRKNNNNGMVTFRNIQELRATGIRLKSSKKRRLRDISFSHGWLIADLTLPEIVVDDTTVLLS